MVDVADFSVPRVNLLIPPSSDSQIQKHKTWIILPTKRWVKLPPLGSSKEHPPRLRSCGGVSSPQPQEVTSTPLGLETGSSVVPRLIPRRTLFCQTRLGVEKALQEPHTPKVPRSIALQPWQCIVEAPRGAGEGEGWMQEDGGAEPRGIMVVLLEPLQWCRLGLPVTPAAGTGSQRREAAGWGWEGKRLINRNSIEVKTVPSTAGKDRKKDRFFRS